MLDATLYVLFDFKYLVCYAQYALLASTAVSTGRVHGPLTRVSEMTPVFTSRGHGLTPLFTGRVGYTGYQHGP